MPTMLLSNAFTKLILQTPIHTQNPTTNLKTPNLIPAQEDASAWIVKNKKEKTQQKTKKEGVGRETSPPREDKNLSTELAALFRCFSTSSV
jgi:hypothetical protein